MYAEKTTSNREALEKFGQARFVVVACWPFLMGAVMRLCPRWAIEAKTVAVDKFWRLYMNPEWVAKQHPAMLALILAGHELQHILGSHSSRLIEYQEVWIETNLGEKIQLANCAHDLAINSGLQSFVTSGNNYQGCVSRTASDKIPLELPKEGLYPKDFIDKRGQPFPNGKISEDYAELLISEAKNVMQCANPRQGQGESKDGKDNNDQGRGKGNKCCRGKCGSGGGSQKEDFEDSEEPNLNDPTSGVGEVEREVIKQQVAYAIREQNNKLRGTVPGGMVFWADYILKPSKQPWQTILSRSVRLATNRLMGQHDYSYASMNRRHQTADVIIPGLYKPEPKFVLVIDSSGSMNNSDYAEAFGHISAILNTVGLTKVPVLVCDAAVANVQWVTDIKQIKLTGGGGTDMRVAIEKAAELKYSFIIVLTDGETPWPIERPPGIRSIIACLTRKPHMALPPGWIKTIIQD